MNLPFGLTVNRNKPPQHNVVISDQVKAKNSYEESVAAGLVRKFAGSKVSVNGRPVGRAYDRETMEEIYQGYIFAAIKKIRNRTAKILSAKLDICDPDGNVIDGARHPYQDPIDNAPMDNTLFFAGIASYILILGEGFVFTGQRTMVAGNIKDVQQFELLQSNNIIRTYDDEGNLATYKLVEKLPSGLDKVTHYNPTDVIPIIDLNPFDLKKGYGNIRPIISQIGTENTSTKLQQATLGNALKAPGILSSKEKLEDDDFDNLENAVQQRYTSNDMDKAGTPIVTNGGALEYNDLMTDWDKLAMKEIRGLNKEAFFAALGVSKTILGIEESGTTRETSRTQTEQFILDVCMPLAESILNAFNQDYINNYPQAYQRKKLKMTPIAPIEKDLEQEKTEAEINKKKAETFKTYVDSGMNPQQAAKLADLPVEEGEVIEVVERPQQNTLKLTEEQLAEIRRNGQSSSDKVVIHNHIHNNGVSQQAQTATNALTEKEKDKLISAENKLRKEVKQLDGELGNLYVQKINQIDQKDQEAYINELSAALFTYYSVAVPMFGKNRIATMAEDFDTPKTDFLYNEPVKEIVKQRLAKVSNGHFQTIDKELTKVISDGVRDNLPRNDIVRAVQDKVKNQVEKWEVERLVQTEVSNAFNQATYLADRQWIIENGYTGRAYKIWRTNSPKPCPYCTATAGREIPFDENFYNVGDVVPAETTTAEGKTKQVFFPVRFVDVNFGGLHPNCHCDCQTIIKAA